MINHKYPKTYSKNCFQVPIRRLKIASYIISASVSLFWNELTDTQLKTSSLIRFKEKDKTFSISKLLNYSYLNHGKDKRFHLEEGHQHIITSTDYSNLAVYIYRLCKMVKNCKQFCFTKLID